MSIKSVLLAAPIRIGTAPSAKKYEAGDDLHIDVRAPFLVIERREGDVIRSVGVPSASVVSVEFKDEPAGASRAVLERISRDVSRQIEQEGIVGASVTPEEVSEQIEAATQPKGKKGKG